jgi:hypothetical protein
MHHAPPVAVKTSPSAEVLGRHGCGLGYACAIKYRLVSLHSRLGVGYGCATQHHVNSPCRCACKRDLCGLCMQHMTHDYHVQCSVMSGLTLAGSNQPS